MKTLDNAVSTTMSLLHDLLGSHHSRNFAVRLWDGTTWEAEEGQPRRFTLVLQHPGALRKMVLPPSELALGEAYIYNDFDIEGDIEAVFELGDAILSREWGKVEQLRYGARLLSLPKGNMASLGTQAAQQKGTLHSKERDRQAIVYHYDRSNDFYKLWLDRQMVYSCAYFSTPDESLDVAQERKLDYICRKLRLHPGERLLDIGCGWGGLIMYAAQHYGVEALGITLSQQQVIWARERIREAGLEDRCRVELWDYREVKGTYDKLVSVGMFEHIGEALLPIYFKQAWQLLRPGGVFLNHGIAASATAPSRPEPSFVSRYVFPDGELVPISTTLKAAEVNGFEVRDLESLREHYVYTLRNWVSRLEEHADEAKRATDEVTYRIWRLYMAGSAHGFQKGMLNLYQALLVKPDAGRSELPLTREDWYSLS
jgi:cyclopropane-fatty-acyl-phospholipid synthase